ncbi:hypothetical protein XTALMG727_0345 [Xanthomonas translucens pv. arrhenatheri LMG 727]|uniref:Uncharacterized protein n=1 Tax=Xanthomonas graminis pv. arrhenatheri LMG 727 TaxID=1195923 RepID=A0A0K2ZEU9_9XANT|nr:hypothetical protein XTALMG727_0345 [Xanthomonas translucens pv. arrhenatheri LMG 727]
MVGLFFGTGDRGMIASTLHFGLLQEGLQPRCVTSKASGLKPLLQKKHCA